MSLNFIARMGRWPSILELWLENVILDKGVLGFISSESSRELLYFLEMTLVQYFFED